MNEELAIRVENVSKTFKLPHEKSGSIKSIVIHPFKRNRGYEIQKALDGVSFEVKKGEFFGIVGRNGSGKSTLLKLMAGIYTPTKGHITVNGNLTPFIELGVGFDPELTGRENVYLNGALLGFNRKQMRSMYKDIVGFAELEKFMDQKLKNYSSGMQVRLAFSIATRVRSDVLLIDEILAVGDAAFQSKCFDHFKQLKKDKQTVVFISHDMQAVSTFCEKAVLIDNGVIKALGSSKDVARQYAQLFITKTIDETESKKNTRRYGSGEIKIIRTDTQVGREIVVNVQTKVNKEIDGLLYGLHIVNQEGNEVTAMNNRMINVNDIKHLKTGDKLTFQWRMLNVLSEGKYTVMLTLVDSSFRPLDVFENASAFSVTRKEQSNTSVLPPVSVRHSIQ